MRILLTGATGLVGRHLLTRLIDSGHEVVVLSRDAKKAAATLPYPIRFYSWNPVAEPPPPTSLEGIEAVIHLAGEPIFEKRWTPENKKIFFDSRVLSSRHLVKALENSKTLKRGIFASAIGFYGNRGDETLNEDSRPGDDFLADLCIAWESEARKLQSTCPTLSLRIGLILSPNGGILKTILKPFSLGLGGNLGSGDQWMSWIHIDDLCGLILEALKQSPENAWTGAMNAVAPQPATNKEFTQALAQTLHRWAFLHTPASVLNLLLGEKAQYIVASARILPKRALENGFRFKFMDLPSALRDLVD